MNESPCFEQFSNSTYFDICPSFFLILLGCELGTVVSFLHPKINDGVLLIVSDSKIFFIFSKKFNLNGEERNFAINIFQKAKILTK